ncbi:LysM domain-containing protein [Cryobacterium melibiosiphilum]|uniref:LysM domain-containing protein n=1 Tax=Cryobacterium melibiosiphilum TaxID=995039 RepID=A0A3A5MDM8_9MICO|nr:LysM domain-containing protein [Cryobacterium melibiosiphilum]RJT88220.1 LysM domain-containing protein [Cryobacterium melibiosiphilum]
MTTLTTTPHDLSQRARPKLSLAVALGAALVLTGCAAISVSAPEATSTTDAATDTTAQPATLAPGQVIGTGAFASADGDTTGVLTISAATGTEGFGGTEGFATDEGYFTMRLTDFTSDEPGPLTLLLGPPSVTADTECFDSGRRFSAGEVSTEPTQDFVLGDETGDPSHFGNAVLTRPNVPGDTECLASVAAVAPLVWTLPDLRSGLDPTDAGSRTHAAGTVALTDGVPTSYGVAPDDALEVIAERFGVTVDDIFYLNPGRSPNPRDPVVYAGETLNLDRARR